MVASTESPTRSSRAVGWFGARTIFIGRRCTILVKLPVALSGCSVAKVVPDAAGTSTTLPLKVDVVGVNVNAGALAGSDMAELDFSVICFDVDFRKRHHCHQGAADTHVVAYLHAALRDHSVHRGQNLV